MPTAREYSTEAPSSNLHVQPKRTLAPWSMRRRLARMGPLNKWHTDALPWTKRRHRREGAITNRLKERDGLVVRLTHAAQVTKDRALQAMADELRAITPEGLGLMWYTPPSWGTRPRRPGWYIPDVEDAAVSAALALFRAAGRVLARFARLARDGYRRVLAASARALFRPVGYAYEHASPHPQVGSLSTSRETSCTSGASGNDWLEGIRARRCGDTAAGAM